MYTAVFQELALFIAHAQSHSFFEMAFSCEKNRTTAYSEDLRWRMVWQSQALSFSSATIARNLGVDVSTVKRTVDLFERTGQVKKRDYPAGRAFRVITEPVQLYILHLLLDRPGIYLREIQAALLDEIGIDVTESAICKVLKKAGFTRQKMVTFATQQDSELRSQYTAELALYPAHTLVFVDETGADRRDSLRKKAYSIRGHPLRTQKLLVRGEHISVIAAMSLQGILALQIVRGGVDADVYYTFVCKYLLPKLMPFDGQNEHYVVVQDNCAIHHVQEITDALCDAGVIVQYLPPYSPDYNPIEECFSKVKSVLKAMETEMEFCDDIDTIVLSAFATVTQQDCIGWVHDSGIYNIV